MRSILQILKSTGPSGYPTGLHVSDETVQSLTFTWNPLECQFRNGRLTGYELRFYSTYNDVQIFYTTDTRATFGNLRNSSSGYGLSVAAVNQAGTGDHSPLIEAATCPKGT